ncbi:MAG: phosphomethylpyrimidine synthase ThiC [Methanomassiliicoccales archaeon]|nr:phosphomethylpyrimidine synthase ThiC [Methanomassiliicoccales archaeon]NYT15228.1 phosphomethylpyrimidine synthase ThiC [Methanomassiliicoccales archaeon]
MTLMKEARWGVTERIRRAAEAEGLDPEYLRRQVASGRVVIPGNPIHSPRPVGIGEGMLVKVNVNIGTSRDVPSLDNEIDKARVALRYGTDTLMDLSTGGDIDAIRRAILKEVDVPLGTVPIYQTGLKAARRSAVVDMDEDDMFNGIELHAKDGVDFMTVHCGITKESVEWLKRSKRITDVVSRGGAFLTAWIIHNERENPLYENFDYLLEMAQEYDFTLSLGDGLRPGCIQDATDGPQIQELIILGDLVRRARENDVQVMVEGPGHVPMDQIAANVRVEKTICDGAPFYVLGPLVTDIAPGYDHIVGAIGGALAAYNGADFLCYVTPSEHLSLPTSEDVKEGLIASKIAAHVADLSRGKGMDRDLAMSKARKALDWESMYREAVDPDKARAYRARGSTAEEEGCSMCGDVCAIRILKDYLKRYS